MLVYISINYEKMTTPYRKMSGAGGNAENSIDRRRGRSAVALS